MVRHLSTNFLVMLQAMEEYSCTSSITDVIIENNRRRHVSFLLSKQVSLERDNL